jgi:hypothetical protein
MFITVITIILVTLLILSIVYRIIKWFRSHKFPVAKSLKFQINRIQDISEADNDQVNNLINNLKGSTMSVSLLGKQKVIGTIVPIDAQGNPIIPDGVIFTMNDVIQAGTMVYGSDDVDLFTVEENADNQLEVTVISTGTKAGTGNLSFSGLNAADETITGTESITVSLPETTSTTTTTTEAPPTIPIARGFQVRWSEPEDI